MRRQPSFRFFGHDAESVVAIDAEDGPLGSTVNSIVLNKRNGLAVLTKSRSAFLLDPQPDVQVLHLSCR